MVLLLKKVVEEKGTRFVTWSIYALTLEKFRQLIITIGITGEVRKMEGNDALSSV